MSIRYFVRANSSEGAVNYAQSNLQGIQKVYLIKSELDYLKSAFISRQAAYLQDRGAECEYWCNPSRKGAFEGFVIPAKGLAVVDYDVAEKDERCTVVDIDRCVDPRVYDSLCDYAKVTASELADKMESVYSVYKGAKVIHDEWERIYISCMDFDRLDSFSRGVISRLVPSERTLVQGCRYERFFGSSGAGGNVNYIDSITDSLSKRYFIKGRPGTGKSTFLKKLASALCDGGYECEVYHCGFDPASLDMVVCRELDFCVFDSTSPHEKFPVEDSDEILDFYINSGLEGVDEKYSHKLLDIQVRYSKMIALSGLYFEEAEAIRAELDEKIKQSIDFEEMNNMVYDMLYEII